MGSAVEDAGLRGDLMFEPSFILRERFFVTDCEDVGCGSFCDSAGMALKHFA